MPNVTFDTNCIIALDEDREPAASCLRELLALHDAGRIEVRLVASSASERQLDKSYLTNFAQFQARLRDLSLDHLEILRPPLVLGAAYLGWAVFGGGEVSALEERIHTVLFPTQPFNLRQSTGEDAAGIEHKWRNRRMDVDALWCHIRYGGDIFVTTDKNFLKKRDKLIVLGARDILNPCDAVRSIGSPPVADEPSSCS